MRIQDRYGDTVLHVALDRGYTDIFIGILNRMSKDDLGIRDLFVFLYLSKVQNRPKISKIVLLKIKQKTLPYMIAGTIATISLGLSYLYLSRNNEE